MNNIVEMTRGELYVIRDALEESEDEDVQAALAIVEGALYDQTRELDFNDD